jgi:hypothetical protein
MFEKNEALVTMRQQMSQVWGPVPWTLVREAPPEVEGMAEYLLESQGWTLAATVRHRPEVSRIAVSAQFERGRDGLDLPGWRPGPTVSGRIPWVEVEGEGGARIRVGATA